MYEGRMRSAAAKLGGWMRARAVAQQEGDHVLVVSYIKRNPHRLPRGYSEGPAADFRDCVWAL